MARQDLMPRCQDRPSVFGALREGVVPVGETDLEENAYDPIALEPAHRKLLIRQPQKPFSLSFRGAGKRVYQVGA